MTPLRRESQHSLEGQGDIGDKALAGGALAEVGRRGAFVFAPGALTEGLHREWTLLQDPSEDHPFKTCTPGQLRSPHFLALYLHGLGVGGQNGLTDPS